TLNVSRRTFETKFLLYTLQKISFILVQFNFNHPMSERFHMNKSITTRSWLSLKNWLRERDVNFFMSLYRYFKSAKASPSEQVRAIASTISYLPDNDLSKRLLLK